MGNELPRVASPAARLQGVQPRLGLRATVDAGTLEFIKWFALLAMVLDHTATLVFHYEKFNWPYELGRLAFPLFAYVLGAKLGLQVKQNGTLGSSSAKRLWWWALISMAPYYLATGRIWPPDIFFTLALGATACLVSTRPLRLAPKVLAQLCIAMASLACDYMAPGVYLIVSVFAFYRRPAIGPALAILACCAGLVVLNGTLFTLLAIPVALLAHAVSIPLRPYRWFFYAFYPAHLGLLAAWVHFN